MYPSDSNAGCAWKITVISVQYYKWNVHACSRTVSFQTSGQSCFPGSQDDPFDIDQADGISVADSGTVTDRSGCTG